MSCLQWTESVAAAARAYLFDSAPRFASELWGFAASGLSLEAHDRATFGLEEQPAMPPADAAAGAGAPLAACEPLPSRQQGLLSVQSPDVCTFALGAGLASYYGGLFVASNNTSSALYSHHE